jgi:hypothetical protein
VIKVKSKYLIILSLGFARNLVGADWLELRAVLLLNNISTWTAGSKCLFETDSETTLLLNIIRSYRPRSAPWGTAKSSRIQVDNH